MKQECPNRLSLIPTVWSLVGRAHQAPPGDAIVARQELLERYGGAVRRYLRKLLHQGHRVGPRRSLTEHGIADRGDRQDGHLSMGIRTPRSRATAAAVS